MLSAEDASLNCLPCSTSSCCHSTPTSTSSWIPSSIRSSSTWSRACRTERGCTSASTLSWECPCAFRDVEQWPLPCLLQLDGRAGVVQVHQSRAA
jgi:hypothetical protein